MDRSRPIEHFVGIAKKHDGGDCSIWKPVSHDEILNFIHPQSGVAVAWFRYIDNRQKIHSFRRINDDLVAHCEMKHHHFRKIYTAMKEQIKRQFPESEL